MIDLSTLKRDDVVVIDNKRYVVDRIKHITESKFGGHYHLLLKILPYKRESMSRKFRPDGKSVIRPDMGFRSITRVIPRVIPTPGPVLASFDLPDHNVKEFDIQMTDYATIYTNEFDSHILDALGRKSATVECLSLEEFLRLPTITNLTIEETKMTETTKPKTGKEILEEGIASVDISAGNQLKNMIVQTTNEIRGREMWIANRTKQIAALKELQKDAVKAYDEGTFTHNSKSFNERLNVIQNERVS